MKLISWKRRRFEMTVLAVTLDIPCLWHNGARINLTAIGDPVGANKGSRRYYVKRQGKRNDDLVRGGVFMVSISNSAGILRKFSQSCS